MGTEKGAQNLSNMPRNVLVGDFLEAWSFLFYSSLDFFGRKTEEEEEGSKF
jgi:hypothetical protein